MKVRERLCNPLGSMLLVAALVYWLGACATIPLGPTTGVLPSGTQAVERLEARRRAVHSFVLQGEIHLKGPGGELYGDQLIQGAYPDRLRAQVLGPFGKPLLSMTCDGRRLTVLDYRGNRAFRGPASRRNLGRFLGLELSPAEVYALLTGSIPLVGATRPRVSPHAAPGRALLNLLEFGGSLEISLVFSLEDYRVEEAVLRQWPGRRELNARFSSFTRAGPGVYPGRLTLWDQDDRLVEITSDRLILNQPLDPDVFRLDLPPGIKLEPLP